jgi:small subunit ribosomal protein S16
MAVKLRLQRKGKKKSPTYSIVAADARSPRDGKFLEYLGSYNPVPDSQNFKKIWLLNDRISYWLSEGAQPTSVVARILSYGLKYPRCPIYKKILNPRK